MKAFLKNLLMRATGLSVFHLTLLKSTNHIKWYFLKILEPRESHYQLPQTDFQYRKQVPDAQDERISAQIIEKSQAEFTSSLHATSSIWSYSLKLHYKDLFAAFEGKKASVLASVLSRMFSSSILYGISSGHLYPEDKNRKWGRKILRTKILDDLVVLAEYLGVVRAECAEQGLSLIALKDGAEDLVKRIEARLGIELNFPEVGSAYGLKIGHRTITPEMPEHILVAWRITELLRRYDLVGENSKLRIAEIGAGFGGTAYWLNRLIGKQIQSYTIIDLPVVNIMQAYFLEKSLGQGISFGAKNQAAGEKFRFVVGDNVDQLEGPFDLLINENSMPEIPQAIVQKYLSWALKNVKGHFYSYNQEAYTPRDVQTYVPEVIRGLKGFQLIQRNLSPIRRGYAEELYRLPTA